MSYDIYIGEAEIRVPAAEEADDGDNRMEVRAVSARLDDAPEFPNDRMTGRGNSRHPGYSRWSSFCKTAGIYDLFFDKENGLMRDHPGCFLLRPHHREAVKEALRNWRANHRGAVPGFGDRKSLEDEIARGWGVEENKKLLAQLPPSGEWDAILARLIWLDFWISWTLAHCKVPVIYNR